MITPRNQPPNKADLLRKVAYFFQRRHIRKQAARRGPLPRDVYVPSHRDTRSLVSILIERIRECDEVSA